ncbi:c-type cytochrome [uncultured Celeribacter sp.]|uniref:c-type cytochrome n=1 Tax=uncultured Celeribacter sp. TaxID=1303376 RepID=UPI002AA7DB39|nr:c-type cytochrome [uncultured Celeribacter sp.]
MAPKQQKHTQYSLAIGLLLLAFALLSPAGSIAETSDVSASVEAADSSIARGRYLAIAADCAACHTNGREGTPFAGGYPVLSPFGPIYSTNITPSLSHGIGTYSRAEFARALREGVRKDGANLYPAMPYTSYGRLSDQDISDLYDYLMQTVAPVERSAPETHLPFPFSMRAALGPWKTLNLNAEPVSQTGTPEDESLERGRYLVDGLAHCAECHSPRTLTLGTDPSRYLRGGAVGPWYAPDITNSSQGIGGWSDDDLEAYLKTGIAPQDRAAGPMAEAIEHSFQHLTHTDITSIVNYLRSVPTSAQSEAADAENKTGAKPVPAAFELDLVNGRRDQTEIAGITDGALLYDAVCASCHQTDGGGTPDGYYPPLVGIGTVTSPNPTNLVATILYGVDRETQGREILMPGFGTHSPVQRLSDQQVAAISTYVVARFGLGQTRVTDAQVGQVRSGGARPLIARLAAPSILYGATALFLMIAIALVAVVLRRLRLRSRNI